MLQCSKIRSLPQVGLLVPGAPPHVVDSLVHHVSELGAMDAVQVMVVRPPLTAPLLFASVNMPPSDGGLAA